MRRTRLIAQTSDTITAIVKWTAALRRKSATSLRFHLDEFDRNQVWPFDHCCAHRAPLMDVLGHLHAFALQSRHSGIEVGHTQREVIHDLSTRTDIGTMPWPNQNRNHVAYGNAPCRIPYHADLV